ncbi:hypothetical protein [Kineococcus sp. SYSU DK003]|uniref:hypothetical protein n=1 Tax=Kineococcus sp. SYSU DK003 TaxID=3383124 RepID=UPI003D7CF9AE
MGWTPGAGHAAGVARFLVLGALVCGPVGVGVNLLAGPPTPAPAVVATGVGTWPGQAAEVGNFAAEFVTAWLTTPAGQEDALAFYVPDSPALRLPQTPGTVQNIAVAGIERQGSYRPRERSAAADESTSLGAYAAAGASAASSAATGASASPSAQSQSLQPRSLATDMVAWQVTIAADVAEPGPEGAWVMVRRYFSVPVLQQPAQPGATASSAAAASASDDPVDDPVDDPANNPVDGQGGASVGESAGQPVGSSAQGLAAGGGSPSGPSRLRALTLPQPTAGPASGEGARLAYPQQVSISSPLALSAGEFLNAYLAGQGDIARYLSPGVQLQALTPRAYAAVSIAQVYARQSEPVQDEPSDGQRVQALVGATLTGLDQQQVGAQFALELTGRAGRWEVSALPAVPALDLVPVPSGDQRSTPSSEATAGPPSPAGSASAQ